MTTKSKGRVTYWATRCIGETTTKAPAVAFNDHQLEELKKMIDRHNRLARVFKEAKLEIVRVEVTPV